MSVKPQAKIVRVSKTTLKKQAKQKVKSKILGRESRVSEVERWHEEEIVRYSKRLGFKNLQWKNKEKNKVRSKKEMATLLYFKEVELDL